jgi:hypothetical protein
VRSVRLDPEVDELVRRAAAREGITVSEFLRRGAVERAHRALSPDQRLEGIVGAVHTGGGVARRSGAAFAELLTDRKLRR